MHKWYVWFLYVIDYDEKLQKDEDEIVIHSNTAAPRVDVLWPCYSSVSRYILFWIKKLKALNKLEINRKSSKCFSLHLQIFSHCTFSPSNITTAKVVAMCAHHHGFNLLMPFCFSHRRFPALSEGWWHLSMEFYVIGYFEMVNNL
jgi:hypothetical protein